MDRELIPLSHGSFLSLQEEVTAFLVPGATELAGMASSEAWCTKSWHAMVPTLRDVLVDDYSRCWTGSTDSPWQQTADVCVHRQSWI